MSKLTIIWCPNCGKIKVNNYRYPQCPVCGASIEEDYNEQNNSKRKRDNENSFRKRPRF